MINIVLSTLPVTLMAEDVVSGLLIPLVVVVILVLANGFFVAAEFAILGSRATRMEELSADGNNTANQLIDVLEDVDKQNSYLATAQLGITVVTLSLSMYAEPRIAHFIEPYIESITGGAVPPALLHTVAIIVALSFLTYLHVVIGEMVPKSMALSMPNRVALRLNPLMRLLETILKLPIFVLNGIGNALLRLFRIPPAHEGARLFSSEEIEQLVSESTSGGFISADAEEIISNILDFGDREVGQVMTPRRKVEGIPVEIGQDDLLRVVTESRHSRFPVYEDDLDHIVGILHLKDLVRHCATTDEPARLRQLVRSTPVVPEDQSVEELLTAFKLQRIHMAIVLDEYGGVAGIVTLEDLVEEIVGEVRDEFDVEREPFVEVEPGVIEVAGDYLLDSLKEIVYLQEEDALPDVDTVGGLIVTWLGRPPVLNDKIEKADDVVFTVTGVDGRAVTRVRVSFPAPPEKNVNEESESH